MNKIKYLVLLLIIFPGSPIFSNDTLRIENNNTNFINVYPYVYTFIDSTNDITVNDLLVSGKKFSKSENNSSISFGLNKNNCWTKFSVKNAAAEKAIFLLVVSNPDLNYLDFYEFMNSRMIQEVHTGELREKKSRPIAHRYFLFQLELEPGSAYTYFICSNNEGDTNLVPISLQKERFFYKNDLRDQFFYALIYGILLFIIGFTYYLYVIVKDKIYLFYLFYIFFLTIFFLSYDGYLYYLNWKWLSNMGRILIPSIGIVYFITFAQKFLESFRKWPKLHIILNVLKVVMLTVGILPIFQFTFFVPIYFLGIFLIFTGSFAIFIIYAFKSYNREYIPSQYFLLAFIFMAIFTIVYPLKEIGILPYNFFTVNSARFGFTFESILLTIAVLERFRVSQENAKKTIEESYIKIEDQNKELEFINTELEKLSIVASETDNSVAIYGKTGKIEWCNEGFEKLYETNVDILIKQNNDKIEDIIRTSDIKKLFSSCLDKKVAVTFESSINTKDNKERWLQTTLSPYARSGNIEKIIAIGSDITNLKIYEKNLERAKEQAVEADRLKTVFLGNMSHEIRTPLNGILGFSELLSNKDIPDDKKDKFLKMIRSNGEQLIRIIDDIVDISLIESNQLRINKIEFQLSEFIREIVIFFNAYKTTINKEQIQLDAECNIKDGHAVIITDAVRLHQVLSNLLKNAFKFTEEGYIKFGCTTQDTEISFFVEDTGIGIDHTKKDIIFERFRQGEESLSRRYGGTGLGLSISKGIIDRLEGKIWLDTNYLEGTRICFTIPLLIPDLKNSKAKKESPTKNFSERIKSKHILIVEDHDTSYEYLEEILSPFQTKLSRAINGKQAVELVKVNNYDLVLMDINLPGLDGVAATKEIRKFDPNLLIIAQTAYAMESERDTILAAGCNDLINKPINSKTLFEKLEMHL